MLHIAALKPTTLKSSLSASASSVVLASLEDRHGNAVSLATFGEFGTIVVKSGDQWECIKFDALVNNADGSVTLTVATNGRKILPVTPYTGGATGFDFIAGSSVIVTSDGLIMSKLGNVENAQTWAEIQTFSQPPVVPTPVNGTDAANKNYVDGVAIAGAPDAGTGTKGVTKMSVAPVSATAPIAVGDNDGRVPTQSENDALAGGGSLGSPSSSNKFVTEQGLATAYTPPGIVLPYAGSSAPTGYLLCDGASYLRADYAALFAIIGTTYGAADGTHFNVPNLKGKVPVGRDSGQTEFDTLAETGGAKTHTLTIAEMPAHTHEIGGGSGSGGAGGSATIGGSGTFSGSRGGDGAHNNLQPYIVLNYIIKT